MQGLRRLTIFPYSRYSVTARPFAVDPHTYGKCTKSSTISLESREDHQRFQLYTAICFVDLKHSGGHASDSKSSSTFKPNQRLTARCLVCFSTFVSTTHQPFGVILGMSVAETDFPSVWPVSAVVVSAVLSTPVIRDVMNVLGVRKAGTASILRMFADGFKVSEKAGYVDGKEAASHSILTGWVREPLGQSLHDTAIYIEAICIRAS